MQDPAKQKKLYIILTVVFAVAGLLWMLGLFTPNRFLFGIIGLINWGIAWYCWQMGKAG